jgi:tripartite-type tricarboxylate transporter receptor subunit TctC
MFTLRIPACLIIVALLVASCGGSAPTGAASQAPTASQAQDVTPKFGPDGKLMPLADGFPSEPLKLWAAFPPGNTEDVLNVVVASIAKKYSPVPIETQARDSGPTRYYDLVGYLRNQRGGLDGYHMFSIAAFGSTLYPYTIDGMQGRKYSDLAYIGNVEEAPFAFVVKKDSPYRTLADVEAFARQNPDRLVVVGSTTGSSLHSSALAWAKQAKLTFRFLPTDGAGQSQTTLLGGGAQLGLLTFDRTQHADLRTIAVTSDKRSELLKDVPNTKELGYNIPSGGFDGYATLPEVPASHRAWLEALVKRVTEDPELATRRPGYTIAFRPPAEMDAMRKQITDTFIALLDELGLVKNKP